MWKDHISNVSRGLGSSHAMLPMSKNLHLGAHTTISSYTSIGELRQHTPLTELPDQAAMILRGK